ncbi:hypothetical protein Tco_1351607 [Tanacetum coccineum]
MTIMRPMASLTVCLEERIQHQQTHDPSDREAKKLKDGDGKLSEFLRYQVNNKWILPTNSMKPLVSGVVSRSTRASHPLYGYIKNHKKTVKNGQARTRERKSVQKSEAKPRKRQSAVKSSQSGQIMVNRSQP